MGLPELQRRLIYAIIVAGKSARFTEGAITRLLDPGATPFKWLKFLLNTDRLDEALRAARTGNYTKIGKAIRALLSQEIDLRSCTPEQLEVIHGIGPKTSRFFILWTRPNERYAALDVHVLRWLRGLGHAAPRSTPNGKKYRELEKIFLSEADKRGLSAGDLDSKIWQAAAQNGEPVL